MWEHAYYLKYQNKRPDYLAAIFNVIDWSAVAERYTAARSASGDGLANRSRADGSTPARPPGHT